MLLRYFHETLTFKHNYYSALKLHLKAALLRSIVVKLACRARTWQVNKSSICAEIMGYRSKH